MTILTSLHAVREGPMLKSVVKLTFVGGLGQKISLCHWGVRGGCNLDAGVRVCILVWIAG